jgi:hypothetical protein
MTNDLTSPGGSPVAIVKLPDGLTLVLSISKDPHGFLGSFDPHANPGLVESAKNLIANLLDAYVQGKMASNTESTPPSVKPKKSTERFATAVIINNAIEEVLTQDDVEKQQIKHLIPHRADFARWGVPDNGISGHGREFSIDDALKRYALFYRVRENCELDDTDRQRIKDRILGMLHEKDM